MFIKILKKLLLLLIVVAILGALVRGGMMQIQRKKEALAKAPKYGMQPLPVRVVTAEGGSFETKLNYLAVVQPMKTAEVSARLTATIDEVLFDEKDHVKAGDELFVLDGRQIESDLKSLDAQIEAAQAELAANQASTRALAKTVAYWKRQADRDQKLAESGAIPGAQAEGTADKADESEGQLVASEARSKAIESQVGALVAKRASLEVQLSYTRITAPFDAVVSQRLVDPGDLASPGKTLMILEDRDGLKLAFDVPQADLSTVHEGLPVLIGKRRVKLSHLFPSLDHARMLRAEVFLGPQASAELSPGAWIPVEVVTGKLEAVSLLPVSTLIESPDGHPSVFVVRDHKLESRPVEVMAREGGQLAVRGVDAAETVVQSTFLGWARLASGMDVELIR